MTKAGPERRISYYQYIDIESVYIYSDTKLTPAEIKVATVTMMEAC